MPSAEIANAAEIDDDSEKIEEGLMTKPHDLLEAQKAPQMCAFRNDVSKEAEKWHDGEGLAIPFPMLLLSGQQSRLTNAAERPL